MKTQDNPSTGPHYVECDGIAQLQLTMAVNDYDHVRDLANGVVRADGILLTPLLLSVEEIFFRFTYHQEWEVSEMSFAKYVSLTAVGNAPMVAIPVFPSRVFRHSAFYIRNDSGIEDAKQLEGKTVGIPEWAQTAGVYVRGMLADYYGVDLFSINWVQAGVNQAGRKEKVNLTLPEGISYTSRQDASLNEMLLSGEIDVAITARPPLAYTDAGASVKRLFSDPRSEEKKVYLKTGIFPIMHVIVIRRDVFEANRWIAMNLYKAFEAAKQRSLERLTDITASSIPVPWAAALIEEIASDIGGELWPYGIQDNLPTLEAFCRYAYEQGVASRHLAVEELFPKEVHASFKV
jgi:4,5-dihydroxyphthalate decarboxylase